MKNYINKLTVALVMLLSFVSDVRAQGEQLFYLNNNPEIARALLEASARGGVYRVAQSTNDTLSLPFFEDFSISTVWPSQELWTDSLAFVSPGFAINPPTFGCATLDGLNKVGNPYDNSTVNASGLCDALTSKPINLFEDENGLPYVPSDSIFLVFYYQRKGRGDAPESNDSLRLEFFNVGTQTWDRIWRETGVAGGDTIFNKVKISIDDPSYRQKGFRFRFRNYGSKTGNLDIWNIDYISLDRFLPPDYENVPDFAWVYQATSLLNEYSAVPWKHYSQLPASQQQAMVKTSAPLTLRNNNLANPFPISIAGVSIDQYGALTQIVGGGGSNNIQVPLNTNVNPPAALLTNTFFQDPTTGEQAWFDLKYVLGQTSGGVVDEYPVNDTLRYTQDFHNYYSFDDGTAELGYGINGIGGQLAYKFEILRADTLRAVQIFFTQLGLSVTNQIFKLAVWTGNNTPNGSPIYEKFNQTPNYIDSINGFYTYLTDPVYLSPGTYFFGMIQNSSTILNLGLDINTPADQSRKLINTTGNWINSQLPGMWMIRPVFSGTPIDVSVPSLAEQMKFTLYPIPATDVIQIRLDKPYENNLTTLIYDALGRIVYQNEGFDESVDVSVLEEGFYILQLKNSRTGQISSARFTISD